MQQQNVTEVEIIPENGLKWVFLKTDEGNPDKVPHKVLHHDIESNILSLGAPDGVVSEVFVEDVTEVSPDRLIGYFYMTDNLAGIGQMMKEGHFIPVPPDYYQELAMEHKVLIQTLRLFDRALISGLTKQNSKHLEPYIDKNATDIKDKFKISKIMGDLVSFKSVFSAMMGKKTEMKLPDKPIGRFFNGFDFKGLSNHDWTFAEPILAKYGFRMKEALSFFEEVLGIKMDVTVAALDVTKETAKLDAHE